MQERKDDKEVRRIGIIWYSGGEFAGIENFVKEYYGRFCSESFQIDLIFLGNNTFSSSYQNGLENCQKYALHCEYKNGNLCRLFSLLRKFYKFLKDHSKDYDIIEINSCSILETAVILFVAKLFGIKRRVAHSHSAGGGLPNNVSKMHDILKKILSPFFQHIILIMGTDYLACSRAAGKLLFGNCKKVKIVHNAINIKRFRFDVNQRIKIRNQLNLEKNFVVGHVGRFSAEKNYDFIIDVFAMVVQKRADVKLLLLGEGELQQDIKAKVERLGLSQKVIFIGAVVNPEDYYQAMDCFILPSFFEGLSFVGVEAQASGLPCLLADTIPQEVQLTDLVQFLPITDINVWVEEICKIQLNDKREIYADKVAEAGYDINVEAKKLENFYLTGNFE